MCGGESTNGDHCGEPCSWAGLRGGQQCSAPSSASSPAGPGGLPGRAGPGWVELGSAGCTRLIPETLRGLSAGAKPFLAESEHRTCTRHGVQLPDLHISGWPLK